MTEDFKPMKEMTEQTFAEVQRTIDIDVFGEYRLRFNRTPAGYVCVMDEHMLKDLQAVLDAMSKTTNSLFEGLESSLELNKAQLNRVNEE